MTDVRWTHVDRRGVPCAPLRGGWVFTARLEYHYGAWTVGFVPALRAWRAYRPGKVCPVRFPSSFAARRWVWAYERARRRQ